jgi:hypothetical protein
LICFDVFHDGYVLICCGKIGRRDLHTGFDDDDTVLQEYHCSSLFPLTLQTNNVFSLQLLKYDHQERITAKDAQQLDYFKPVREEHAAAGHEAGRKA